MGNTRTRMLAHSAADFDRSVRSDALSQAVRKFDGECQFGFARRNGTFQLLSLLEIAIRLARGNGAIPSELFDGIGKLFHLLKQHQRAIESLGLLNTAGAGHLS